ncbi:MAG: hypothetical protein WBM17_02850 [Anaerolineales bacterium]
MSGHSRPDAESVFFITGHWKWIAEKLEPAGARDRVRQVGLVYAAQAHAILADRDYVTPDDVKAVAIPVLGHRLPLTLSARRKGVTPKALPEGILESTMVPGNL